ncbi:small, acid-soluble spore protein, alpha/beta type [Bacillota bacterium LX-D]|nr:small, acid-soluble spore protein, alpha/beta type [Bacillota bacterium LX-D]
MAKIMSDALKWELAKELGVEQIVATEGFGGVPSRECGRLVAKAIELAERSLINPGTPKL